MNVTETLAPKAPPEVVPFLDRAPEVTDEEHRHALAPDYILGRDRRLVDEVAASKAARIAVIRQDNQPMNMEELNAARNRALHALVRRMPEMKPAELMDAVELLDGEMASRRVKSGPGATERAATREEMLAAMQARQPT